MMSLMMLATPIIFAKEVVGLTERGSATIDLHNVVHHFDRIMSLLKRKCKGRCSLKRRLEEYCAFRLGALWFEEHYGVSFDDEARLVEELKRVAETFEG
jgi:hypothetical protein